MQLGRQGQRQRVACAAHGGVGTCRQPEAAWPMPQPPRPPSHMHRGQGLVVQPCDRRAQKLPARPHCSQPGRSLCNCPWHRHRVCGSHVSLWGPVVTGGDRMTRSTSAAYWQVPWRRGPSCLQDPQRHGQNPRSLGHVRSRLTWVSPSFLSVS